MRVAAARGGDVGRLRVGFVGVDRFLPAANEVVEIATLSVGEGDVLEDATDAGGVVGGDRAFEGVVKRSGFVELVLQPAPQGDEDPSVVVHALGLPCGA